MLARMQGNTHFWERNLVQTLRKKIANRYQEPLKLTYAVDLKSLSHQ